MVVDIIQHLFFIFFIFFKSKDELSELIKLVEENEPSEDAPNPADWLSGEQEKDTKGLFTF